MPKILIVEDEPSTLNVLSTLLKAEGYDVTAIDRGDEASKLIDAEPFDLMLSDIHMTPVDGMQLLKHAHENQPNMAVLMLTGYGKVETAVESLKLGAFDYITKPFKVDELFITVQKALEASESRAAQPTGQTEDHYRFDNLVAASEPMRKACEMIERVAQTDVMVLICGEDGVGKSLVAQTIHQLSKRRDNPFIRVTCPEMTETILMQTLFGASSDADEDARPGAFQQAHGGTVYIDGIQTMPLAVQDCLLEILREKKIPATNGSGETTPLDVRIVTSCNADLDALVDSDQMREDLYYRLSALPIEIKPLRERPEDILPLVFRSLHQFLGDDKPIPAVSPDACNILEQYRWPGNVRELENVVKHALASTKDTLGRESLPPTIINDLQRQGQQLQRKTSEADAYRAKSLKAFLREQEKKRIQNALQEAGGNVEKAAKALKINPAALNAKIKAYKL